jgi:type IV pilus assembly protein PilM
MESVREGLREARRADDIRQTVSVAMAYYEDTLSSVPTTLYYIGPGTVAEFAVLLGEGLLAPRTPGETQMTIRELLPDGAAESLSVPRALLAPVAGALVNG